MHGANVNMCIELIDFIDTHGSEALRIGIATLKNVDFLDITSLAP